MNVIWLKRIAESVPKKSMKTSIQLIFHNYLKIQRKFLITEKTT